MSHKLILVDTSCFCPSCKAKIDALSNTAQVKEKVVKPKLTAEERKIKAREYAREYYRKHKIVEYIHSFVVQFFIFI